MEKHCQSEGCHEAKEQLLRVKDLFEAMVSILETEGDREVDYAKKELRKNIGKIEDVFNHNIVPDKIFDEIKESYQSMYPSHGGLTEFFVWRDDFEERRQVNLPLDNIKSELKEIVGMKW
ncbi:MAG TPA: hypothetical protein DDW50_02405 [Firmicutes bacterium]|jgi:hypothetical protein|nr:hypothetical protein [Bacillota bacterium]